MSEEKDSGWLPLAQDYLNGTADATKTRLLEEKLLESAEARTGFRRYARTDVALRETAEAVDAGETSLLDFGGGARSSSGRAWIWAQAAAMLAMAAVIVALVFSREKREPEAVEIVGRPEVDWPAVELVAVDESEAMAVLTHAVGVEWEQEAGPVEGASLRPEMLQFSSGYAQVEFFSGATLVVEGPAEFELIDPMKVRCVGGRFRASVPHFARGFTVGCGELTIVDLGTEFGLSVDADGTREIHVFDGEVAVEGGAVGTETRHLLAGTGIRVGADRVDYISSVDEAFADAEHISSLASAAADEQRRAWLQYSEGLKANSDVTLFYSFDNQVAWSRRLSNDKKMIADPLYGAIIGCRWAEGRWRGKAALEFKRPSDRVRIGIPGSRDEITLMAWVRIDGFDRSLNSLMLSDGWHPGGFHWQISGKGELIAGVHCEGSETGHYQSGPVIASHHLGEWLHLAVSYGGPGGEVIHFVNGEPVSRTPVVKHHRISVPRGELGNWSPGVWPPEKETDIRNLNGRMDEFLVFATALAPEEVAAIYERGSPR